MNEEVDMNSPSKLDPLRIVRVELASLLVAEVNPISVEQIERRYEEEFGSVLDPTNYGFACTEHLLGALTDKIVAVTIQGRKLFRTKYSREFKDLQKMVQCQTTKEERKQNTLRREKQRFGQFGSKFKTNFVRTGGFENSSCAQYCPTTPPPPLCVQPPNMISSVYAAVKKYGTPNKYGFLSITVAQLQEVLKNQIPGDRQNFGDFCELLRSAECAPHWRLEVKCLDEVLGHILTMNVQIRQDPPPPPPPTGKEDGGVHENSDSSKFPSRVVSKGGKQLAINSLKSALWFNKQLACPRNESSQSEDNASSMSEATSQMERLDISASRKTSSVQTYSRDEVLSLRDSVLSENKIEQAISKHPKISSVKSDDGQSNKTNSKFDSSSSRYELSGFSQNIIHPIAKEESEVYRQIEHMRSEEPVRSVSSRFVAPSSSRSSFTARTVSPCFGSQIAMDQDRSSIYSRAPPSLQPSRMSTQSEQLPMTSSSLSARQALEKMNAIDNELRLSQMGSLGRKFEGGSHSSYSGITESNLSKFKSFKFVQDPSIDDIKMCAPMYFVPPCSVLICFENGNEDGCARFCEIQNRLQVHFSKQSFDKLKTLSLGTICVARSADSNEYARVVIVEIKGQTVTGACLDYHGFVTADYDTLAVLPDIFSPQYLPCNTFLSRINGIQSVPQTAYKDVSDSIAERSSESNEFILFTTAIFGIDPAEDKIVVDWITSDGCWKSTELTQKFNALHRSSDPQHPTSDEVDKATEELENTPPQEIELKWYFSDSESMLKKQVDILQTMCANFDRPESSNSAERQEVPPCEERREPSVERLVSKVHNSPSPAKSHEVKTNTMPAKRELEPISGRPSSEEFGEEHIKQMGEFFNALSKQLYPEVRPVLKHMVGAIAELAKNASREKRDTRCWDNLMDSLK